MITTPMVDRRVSHPVRTIDVVTITATLVAPDLALDALAGAIDTAKETDRLAPVTVVVPTNTCGVMTRRALGRKRGIAGVDMVTLGRLAELVAGPQLAAAGRSPVSTPVVDLTIAGVLASDPGPFRTVASHPSTIVALRRLHDELRSAGPDAVQRLAASSRRGARATAVSTAVTDALAADWYDQADLLALAAESVRRDAPTALRNVVVHLPQELSGLELDFVRAIGEQGAVRVIAQLTGDDHADADVRSLVAGLGAAILDDEPPPPPTSRPVGSISTTDADDEVRLAVRRVLDAARAGTAFERIAVVWSADQPYARLVEHHLTSADLPWNGRPGTTVAERLAPRLVLDLLDVDRRGLRRNSVFDLLADVPARDGDGTYLPTASWERVSREAGVARDDDWNRRLGSISTDDRWRDPASSLREFVGRLRDDLGHPSATRPWSEWATWCEAQVERWLGRHTIDRLPEAEYRAWEALGRALDRLRHLDPVGRPVTRHRFRTTLAAELDATSAREGRVGHGVTVGHLAGAVGLDVDVTVVLGAAEGLLPPAPANDPLLSDADRLAAGLPTADDRTVRLHRLLLAACATSAVTVTFPRGDLRATADLRPSRWIAAWIEQLDEIDVVASHQAGLLDTSFPISDVEHRLRSRAARASAGRPLSPSGDDTLERGVTMVAARRSDTLTVFDGDLSACDVPALTDAVSPSRLESWVACPHAYFARYLLGVEPVDEPGAAISISGRDRGSAHHHALDLFHRMVIEGELPQPGPDGWGPVHRDALERCFSVVCERTERRGRTGRPAFWADERDRMLADLQGWLDHDSVHVRARGATVLASEFRFGGDGMAVIRLPDGRGVELKGMIDRVDRAADGSLVVTDHKSGASDAFKRMSPDDPTAGGTLFQLPAYSAAARSAFGEPATPVHAEYGLLAKGRYERPGFAMTPEVDARVRDALATVVAGIESGYFPNRPERPGWRLFVPCEYCEPDHLGTAERWDEWSRKRHDPRLTRWFEPADDT